MPVTPFRSRITQPGNAPPWLRDGTGERLLYTFGLMIDARMDRLVQGMLCRIPRSTIANNYQAPTDALNLIGASRGPIIRGPAETDAAYALRVQQAPGLWQIWGSARAILSQLNAFFFPNPPPIYLVTNSGHWQWMPPDGGFHTLPPASRPPNAASNWVWDPQAADPAAINVTGASNNGGNVKLAVTTTATILQGSAVDVSGIVGTDEANGTWPVNVNDATHVTLLRSKFTNAWISGGVVQPRGAWWRFWVIVDCSGGFLFTQNVWGQPGLKWGQPGLIWGAGTPANASQMIAGIRNVVQQWMPMHSVCTNIILDYNGHFRPTGSGAGYPAGNWQLWANRYTGASYIAGVSP